MAHDGAAAGVAAAAAVTLGRGRGRGRTELLVVTALGAAGFAGWAWWAGQDANWDLQNYHRYAAYALLHWRYPLEVGAGGFQAYLNPVPYVLPYVLGAMLPPLPAGIVLAVLQSVVVPIVWGLSCVLLPGRCVVLRGCATAAGVCSATTIAEIGTSFADLPTAALVLAGLLTLLRSEQRWSAVVLAGLLVGAAAGLKLTNLVFAPALLAACLVLPGSWRRRWTMAAFSAAGLGMGMVTTGGAWSGYLWHAYGNPLFPGLNSVFRSPSADISDFTERHFLPDGWLDALTYPLRIARGLHPTAEAAFREPRLLAVLLAVVAALVLRPRRLAGALVLTGVFTGVSGALWLGLFAIERYAVPIEMLAGLLTVAVLAQVPARGWMLWPGRVLPVLAAALLLAVTQPSDWWHRPWAQAYVPHVPAAVTQPAAFVVVSYPEGDWAPALNPASRFYGIPPIGLATGGVLRRLLDRGLAAPPDGRMWTVGPDIPMAMDVRAALASHGLVPSAPCLRAPSLWFVDTVFCRLVPGPSRPGLSRPGAAASLDAGQTVSFTNAGAGWIYETGRWAASNPGGTQVLGPPAGLVFSSRNLGATSVLELAFAGDARRVEIVSRGARLTTTYDAGGIVAVCIPSDEEAPELSIHRVDAVVTLRRMTLRATRPGECGRSP